MLPLTNKYNRPFEFKPAAYASAQITPVKTAGSSETSV